MDSARILDVPPFIQDESAGDGGAHALCAALTGLGRKVDYPAVKAVSGDGFKFVYDRAPVYEAMRDLTPSDYIRDGLGVYRVEGSWRTGYTLEELVPMIVASIEAGWPLVTSNLLDTRGYQLIVGIDAPADGPRRVAVRAPRPTSELDTDPPPTPRWARFDAEWDGPLSGRARWDINPVFVIQDVGSARAPKQADLLSTAIEAGIRAYETYEIAYGTSGLDDTHAGEEPLAGRSAGHASDAWASLADDVKDRLPLSERFDFVWKAFTVMQRLAHDREALAAFFEGHAGRAKGGEEQALNALVADMKTIAAGASELAQLIWNGKTGEAHTPEDYQQLLASSRSLAYPVPQHRGFPDRLREMGYGDRIHSTLWGEAILMGDLVRWREVMVRVDRLADLEAGVENRLRRFGG